MRLAYASITVVTLFIPHVAHAILIEADLINIAGGCCMSVSLPDFSLDGVDDTIEIRFLNMEHLLATTFAETGRISGVIAVALESRTDATSVTSYPVNGFLTQMDGSPIVNNPAMSGVMQQDQFGFFDSSPSFFGESFAGESWLFHGVRIQSTGGPFDAQTLTQARLFFEVGHVEGNGAFFSTGILAVGVWVPEPSTLILAALGLLNTTFLCRRRRR